MARERPRRVEHALPALAEATGQGEPNRLGMSVEEYEEGVVNQLASPRIRARDFVARQGLLV